MDTDLRNLEGTWTMIAAEADGARLTSECVTLMEFEFTVSGDHFILVSMMDGEEQSRSSGRLKTDSTSELKKIDLIEHATHDKTSGDVRLADQYGIYEIDGDHLRICMVVNEENRPTGFTTVGRLGMEVPWPTKRVLWSFERKLT